MEEAAVWPDDAVILYDGICVLCSRWVRFAAKRDVARRFRFTPIESPYGRRLARALGIDPADPDTNAVILEGHALTHSDAALAVLSALPSWGWVGVLRLIPRSFGTAFTPLLPATGTTRLGDMLYATSAACRSPTARSEVTSADVWVTIAQILLRPLWVEAV